MVIVDRAPPATSWHSVWCFNEKIHPRLTGIGKGSVDVSSSNDFASVGIGEDTGKGVAGGERVGGNGSRGG